MSEPGGVLCQEVGPAEANTIEEVSFIKPNPSSISNAFQKYFGILTENTDRNWQVDANISIRMKEQGQLRDVRTMSAGYKDLIGICMRFALVDAMYPGEKPFLILDDPFVNLDDEKLARGRRLLAVLSQDYQVIYFTCHGSRE